MRIRTLIMSASAAVSLLLFGGGYLVIEGIFDASIKENAAQTSAALASLTFNSMYEVMSTGWRRPQVESFIGATQQAMHDSTGSIQIFRGPVVVARYGEIDQPPLDELVRRSLDSGEAQQAELGGRTRHAFPLKAEMKCLACHGNARIGEVLGAIEVSQDLTPFLERARGELRWTLGLLLPISLLIGGVGVWWVHRRLSASLAAIGQGIAQVNAVADLRRFSLSRSKLGIVEFDRIFDQIGELVHRLRDVAVDKDILKFEIGLLEKFVITSDVVKDWRDYICRLLVDINQVIKAHVLFSIFKIDEELFDLEIFWRAPPTEATRLMIEGYVREALTRQDSFRDIPLASIHTHVADSGGEPVALDAGQVRLHVKALFVETPKIGGIVGIGVHSHEMEDETLRLVMDSILSTLLNVVGSVKAIYKYTRDLEYYATRDPLTELFNQRVFWELLAAEIMRARRHGNKFALLLIDLDNFRLVNERYGHTVGDRFLQGFARAVRGASRDGDILCRYGGDEFVAILPETDLEQAALVAQRVSQAAEHMDEAAPDGVRIKATISVGIAVFPDHADDAKDIFLFADNMMYKAKTGGKSRIAVPTAEDVVTAFRDITQKSVMVLNAIEEKRLLPFYQPILDIASGEIAAYEVLSRIELDSRLVAASDFIEIAEKVGVIERLDCLILEKALQSAVANGHRGQIFINLSPRALVLRDFSRSILRIVGDSHVEPQRIVFEITERDTVKNIAMLERLLHDLKFEGFGLAIDDFGSGFSSFHYLRRFPIDYLKIEGDFIVNMLDNAKDRAFVQNMQSLASKLGIKVIAEYVESAEVLAEVKRMGIELAQGYYVGRPLGHMLPQSRWLPPTST
jgi:diguanylate cyclase (GGDEF)-like protein